MVLEHAGTRAEASPAFSAPAVAMVRARLNGAIPEMIEAIGRAVPEYASPSRPDYQQRLADAVTGAVASFIARVQAEGNQQRQLLGLILADPPPRPEQVAALARATGWPLPAQVAVVLLPPAPDPVPSGALPSGALPSGAQPPGAQPPDPLPPVALPPDPPPGALPPGVLPSGALPPGVLADWAAAVPCLLVPDPDGPGRQAALDRALHGQTLLGRPRTAVIGPSVPLARAAQSLRWARQARALAQAGVIPAGHGLVRCDQHLSTLLILADEDLAAALCRRRLAPLDRLRPAQRDRAAETLLAWLQLGENVAGVAQRIHVHPQTVRYRLRQIQELFGDQLRDPARRFELQLALHIRTLTTPAAPASLRRPQAGHRAPQYPVTSIT